MSAISNILVVEDDDDVREMLKRVLESDYTVVTAENGLDGMLKATGDPRPDLIISDVRMPKMDGLQMVEQLKKDKTVSDIPVIFLTAKGTSKDVISGIKAGARHYLTKPFDINEVVEKVKKAMPR